MNGANERRVVVGVDGSHSGQVAAEWAAQEAELRKLSLEVMLAVNEPVPGHSNYVFPPPVIAAVRVSNRKRLDAAVAAIARQHPGLPVLATLGHMDPRRALVSASGEAVMTVVGTRGLGRVPEVLLGSVSLFVAARAHSPVVVVPSTADAGSAAPSGPILVGIDGTAESAGAFGFALDEAEVRKTGLLAVLVIDDPDYRRFGAGSDLMGRLADDDEKAGCAKQLAGWRAKYPDVPVHHVAMRGRPAETLLEYAKNRSSDERPQLIVVGSRGRAGGAGLLLGSTSQKLISHAEVPVIVVKEDSGV